MRKFERPHLIDGDNRSAYQRDKARVLHSASFRRLQSKTQVVGMGVNDFTRTRLTHSLEAAQIGTGICSFLSKKYSDLAEQVRLDEHLIETICLAHDIGHPPFGHGGEKSLNQQMHAFGGFEGNGQTFRIITKLESYSETCGMNLSRRSLLGVIKYPNFMSVLNQGINIGNKTIAPPKALYDCDRDIFDWVLEPLSLEDKTQFMTFEINTDKHHVTMHKSIDCSIMELADDIAYAIHDLEDAIVVGMISREQFRSEISSVLALSDTVWLANKIDDIEEGLFASVDYKRKNTIGSLVNYFITHISLKRKDMFEDVLLDFIATLPPQILHALNLFKQFVLRNVIKKPELQLVEYKGQKIIAELFDAFNSEPDRLLPTTTKVRWQSAPMDLKSRIICDYISGMTDDYANKLYRSLFIP